MSGKMSTRTQDSVGTAAQGQSHLEELNFAGVPGAPLHALIRRDALEATGG